MKIALILCYGVYEQTNDHYRGYLDRVLSLVQSGDFDQVIIAGGNSNPKLNFSEAKSVSDYLLSLDETIKVKLLLEEESLTTEENIKFVEKLLKQKDEKISEVVVFCDSIRMIKVYGLSMFYLAKLCGFEFNEEEIYLALTRQCLDNQPNFLETSTLEYKNILIQGMGLSRSIHEVSIQISATLLEIESLKFPKIAEEIVSWRKIKWGIE